MKRLDETRLRPGDIILTGGRSKLSLAVRKALGGEIAHALLYLQFCSAVDSTMYGVRTSNTQRMLFHEDETVIALRPRADLSADQLRTVLDYARSQNGARYDLWGAARSRKGTGPSAGNRQFCSRLVSRAYAAAGIVCHEDVDYCSPQHLVDSELFEEVPDPTVVVSDAEAARWGRHPNGVDRMWKAQAALLKGVRRLDDGVENFEDVVQFVLDHPEKDERVSRLLRRSDFLDVWRFDLKHNPWRTDIGLMADMPPDEVDVYCRATLDDEPGGGDRYHQMLATLVHLSGLYDRVSLRRLVTLHEKLCELHERRLAVARRWSVLRPASSVPGAGPVTVIAPRSPSVTAG